MSYYKGNIGACGVPLTGRYVAVNTRPGSPWTFPCGTRLTLQYKHKTTTVVVKDRMGAYPEPGCKCLDVAPIVFCRLGIPTSQGIAYVKVITP
jgi:hypothetical protein